jgi:hypothetical protein
MSEKEQAYLIRRGFDGLWTPDGGGCGCHVGDLYPCGHRLKSCRPGYIQVESVNIGPRDNRRPKSADQ